MNEMDTVLAGVGSKTTQAGAGTSVLGWMLSSEAGVVIGVLIGLAGLGIQFYFGRRRDKREQAEHEARMRGNGT